MSFHSKRFFTCGIACCLATHPTHCALGSLYWNSFGINFCRLVLTNASFSSQTCQVRVWIRWKRVYFLNFLIRGDAIGAAECVRMQNLKSEGYRLQSSILPLAWSVVIISEFIAAGRCTTNWGFNFILQYLCADYLVSAITIVVINALTLRIFLEMLYPILKWDLFQAGCFIEERSRTTFELLFSNPSMIWRVQLVLE